MARHQSILITTGVNAPAGGSALTYAESDAAAMHEVLTGPRGPAWTTAEHGNGALLTATAVDGYLRTLSGQQPNFLAFYFAGHGSESGIALADRHYYFNELVDRMAEIAPVRSLLVLDTCHAAGYQRALMLKEAQTRPAGRLVHPWRAQLEQSVPGSRYMYAARIDQNSRESPPYGGHFTWALRHQLQTLRADPGSTTGWISDRHLFANASALMQHQFGPGQTPESWRLDGTLGIMQGVR
ncbi:MAG: caspase family protein [Myxococcaceae bacterium]|nr:MAG: caspase family protein [Myxococcaceae bacterium]